MGADRVQGSGAGDGPRTHVGRDLSLPVGFGSVPARSADAVGDEDCACEEEYPSGQDDHVGPRSSSEGRECTGTVTVCYAAPPRCSGAQIRCGSRRPGGGAPERRRRTRAAAHPSGGGRPERRRETPAARGSVGGATEQRPGPVRRRTRAPGERSAEVEAVQHRDLVPTRRRSHGRTSPVRRSTRRHPCPGSRCPASCSAEGTAAGRRRRHRVRPRCDTCRPRVSSSG